jgi:hypothetical protein
MYFLLKSYIIGIVTMVILQLGEPQKPVRKAKEGYV